MPFAATQSRLLTFLSLPCFPCGRCVRIFKFVATKGAGFTSRFLPSIASRVSFRNLDFSQHADVKGQLKRTAPWFLSTRRVYPDIVPFHSQPTPVLDRSYWPRGGKLDMACTLRTATHCRARGGFLSAPRPRHHNPSVSRHPRLHHHRFEDSTHCGLQ